MKTRIRIAVASLGLMGAFAAAPLALAGQSHESLPVAAHQGGVVNRIIVIDNRMRSINVNEGETIRFVVGQKSFAWLFDRFDQGSDLKDMAPKGMLDRSIKVYVGGIPVQN
jgi:hypothetical protein